MDKLKKEILSVSSELFCKYGLKSVSIDDICSKLGISKKTFYNYFKQKGDLILEVLEEVHKSKENIGSLVEKLNSNPDLNAIDRIQEISNYFKNNKEKTNHSFIYDLSKYYPQIHEKFNKAKEDETVAFAKTEIEKGIKEGIYREDLNLEMTAKFISYQFKNIVSSVEKRSELHAAFSFVIDAYIRIVVNEKGMEYYQNKYINN